MDESNVAEYPIVNISTNIIAQSHPIKYPMAGQKSHTTSIGIYRPETNETIYLKTGAPEERYLTNLTWSPDEKEIYLTAAKLEKGYEFFLLKPMRNIQSLNFP